MRTTVSEPLGAVAPVTPRDSRSAIPGPAGGRAGPFTALFHPPLRSFFSYGEGRRGAAKEKGRSRRKEGGRRVSCVPLTRGRPQANAANRMPFPPVSRDFSAGFGEGEGRLSG